MRARKKFTLFISNEEMNDIINIIKSFEHSGVLYDGVTETVNLVQPVISSVVKVMSGREVRRPVIGNIWIKFFNSVPSFEQYQHY